MTMTPSIMAAMSKWPPQIFVIFSSVILLFQNLETILPFCPQTCLILEILTLFRVADVRGGVTVFDCVK